MTNISASEYRKAIGELIKSDCNAISDIKLLEFLLAFCYSPEDAKSYAKKIFAEFGTLSCALSAPTDSLMAIGLSASAAMLLRLSILQNHVVVLEGAKKGEIFNTAEKTAALLVKLFAGCSHERIFLLMLNNDFEYIGVTSIGEGVVNTVSFEGRAVLELAIKNKATKLVLAHNHPSGEANPSCFDASVTKDLKDTCALMGITLLEHFVIAGEDWYPIILFSNKISNSAPRSYYPEKMFHKAKISRALV